MVVYQLGSRLQLPKYKASYQASTPSTALLLHFGTHVNLFVRRSARAPRSLAQRAPRIALANWLLVRNKNFMTGTPASKEFLIRYGATDSASFSNRAFRMCHEGSLKIYSRTAETNGGEQLREQSKRKILSGPKQRKWHPIRANVPWGGSTNRFSVFEIFFSPRRDTTMEMGFPYFSYFGGQGMRTKGEKKASIAHHFGHSKAHKDAIGMRTNIGEKSAPVRFPIASGPGLRIYPRMAAQVEIRSNRKFCCKR